MANVSILVCISVRLVSPKFPPRHSCTLTFLYKMWGIPPAILSVLVSEEGGNVPKYSGECNIVINTSNCLLMRMNFDLTLTFQLRITKTGEYESA